MSDYNYDRERVRCPYCGNWTDDESIERPADYCHHEIESDEESEEKNNKT